MSSNATESTSISLEVTLLEGGRRKAKAQRRSFSSYVATLIDADLRRRKGSAEAAAQPEKAEVAA